MAEMQAQPQLQVQQPTPPPPPELIAISFVGAIQLPAAKNLRNLCCALITQQRPKRLLLMMASWGGSNHEGLALYNFLRALPTEIWTHNLGAIDSIANIVYYAGQRRTAAPQSRFLLHNFTWTNAQGETITPEQLSERHLMLETDAATFKEIAKSNSKMTDADFDAMQLFHKPNLLSANDAMRYGIVHEVLDLKIPTGTQIWNVDY